MITATDSNSLYEIYDSIYNEFKWLSLNKENIIGKLMSEESILELILKNNGCAFSDSALIHFHTLKDTPNYIIGYIYGAQANSVNRYYDYIEFYGMKYLILFMDYFKNFFDEPDIILGRSNYFDAIKNFVDIFISTTTNAAELMGSMSATAASNMYRFAGTFIAADVIDNIVGLDEADVSMIQYNDLRDMLDNIGIKMLLVGIKYME